MRLTLPVIVLMLAVGAAALPGIPNGNPELNPEPMVIGPSHYFFFSSGLNILFLDSIGLDSDDPTGL